MFFFFYPIEHLLSRCDRLLDYCSPLCLSFHSDVRVGYGKRTKRTYIFISNYLNTSVRDNPSHRIDIRLVTSSSVRRHRIVTDRYRRTQISSFSSSSSSFRLVSTHRHFLNIHDDGRHFSSNFNIFIIHDDKSECIFNKYDNKIFDQSITNR